MTEISEFVRDVKITPGGRVMARTPRRSAPLDVDIFCRALGIDPDEVSDGSIVIIPEFGTSKVTLHWEGVKQVEQVQLDRATDLARRAGGDQ